MIGKQRLKSKWSGCKFLVFFSRVSKEPPAFHQTTGLVSCTCPLGPNITRVTSKRKAFGQRRHNFLSRARKLTAVEMRRSHNQQFVAEQLFQSETGPVSLSHTNADIGQTVPHVLYLKTRPQAHTVIRMALAET
jgi:hypothetical protein